jgi:hypothetical protein
MMRKLHAGLGIPAEILSLRRWEKNIPAILLPTLESPHGDINQGTEVIRLSLPKHRGRTTVTARSLVPAKAMTPLKALRAGCLHCAGKRTKHIRECPKEYRQPMHVQGRYAFCE